MKIGGKPESYAESIAEVKTIYSERDRGQSPLNWRSNIYHPRHQLGRLFHEHNRDLLINALNRLGVELGAQKVLDVGCGYGYWLRRFVDLGSDPRNLWGVDISVERVDWAKCSHLGINWQVISGDDLPFGLEEFDLVMQAVVFSSIRDEGLRRKLAGEMARVLKPEGLIFWVDHVKDMGDRLVGFSEKDLQQLFPGFEVCYRQSAHPKYFRWMYKYSGGLARLLSVFTDRWCDSVCVVMRRVKGAEDGSSES